MRLNATVILFVAIIATSGCALRSEVKTVAGRVTYLENRFTNVESQVVGGSETAKKKSDEQLSNIQAQLVELTNRLIAIETSVQTLLGDTTQLTQDTSSLKTEQQNQAEFIAKLDQRLTAIEGISGIRTGSGGNSAIPDPSAFQWASEVEGYQAARKSFTDGDYDRALQQFREQLRRWPEGPYAVNAHFWIGEVYYQKKEYISAIEQYLEVVEKYAKSSKAPDAYYRMGTALIALGEKEKAKRMFENVINLYPESEKVDLAKKQLSSL